MLDEVFAEHHRQLERLRQFVGTLFPAGMEVDQAGDVQPLPVEAVAVVFHHLLGRALGGDRQPDCRADAVHRHRHLRHLGAEPGEHLGGLAYLGVDRRVGLRPAKTFLDDADLQAAHAALHQLAVGLGVAAGVLARVQAVGAGQHFEHQRVVGHGGRHRAGVVERQLDRHHAGVGHQAVGRLHAVDAAVGRRHPDRAALVAADREVDLAGRDQRCAARRRTARRVACAVRVVHRPGGAGVRSAREAEVLADRLADDRGAGVEQARDDGGVDVGHVTLERRGAVHHRHAG